MLQENVYFNYENNKNLIVHFSGGGVLDLDAVHLGDEVVVAEERGRAGELGQDVQAGRARPAVVQLHLVSQAPRLRARLKCGRVKTIKYLHRAPFLTSIA